ncbi:hypothetical protein MNEG_13621, partial [Monoraphidium neglectum]
MDGKKVDAASVRPADWDRLRAGIALKTFTALVKKYQSMGEQEEARRLREARRFARGLFWNVKGEEGRAVVVRRDFDAFFEDSEIGDQVMAGRLLGFRAAARLPGGRSACGRPLGFRAFAYFDKDNDAAITADEMRSSVVAVFKERRNMAASLEVRRRKRVDVLDTDSIVRSLQFGIGVAIHFVFSAVYLLGFSTFSALVLAFTFVFGNSVRNVYESMLFLFVEHAYDVGDLLELDGSTWRVKQIDLMYTVLTK